MDRIYCEQMMYLLEQKHARIVDERDASQVYLLWNFFRKGGK